MKRVILLVIVLMLGGFVNAHDTGEPHDEPAVAVNSWEAVSPFAYMSKGEYPMGIFMAFLWIITLTGIILLFFMVFERLIKPKAKV